MKQELPEVQLYGIGPDEADHAAPLLTAEAVTYIKNNEAFGLALVEEGKARAAVCANFSPEDEAILEIISLYVAPAYRRRKLGGTLLMELLEAVLSETEGNLKGVIASFMPETEGVEALLTKAGFEIQTDEQAQTFRLPVSELADSPLLKRKKSVPEGYILRSLNGTSDTTLRQLAEELKRNRVDDLSLEEMGQALPDCSYVLLNGKLEPKACAIFHAMGEQGIYLSQFFVADGSTAAGMAVLQSAAKALLDRFPGETVLEIPTLTESSAGLVKKLLPSSKSTGLMRAVLDLTK
ncbi:MAG: GNAT family N-acetyltransferase [Eubacterium sp.]|nr:GNAT family N-acetyltransferase [Eubacterium sp.]